MANPEERCYHRDTVLRHVEVKASEKDQKLYHEYECPKCKARLLLRQALER